MTIDRDGIVKPFHTLSIPELNNDHAEISLENLKCEEVTADRSASGEPQAATAVRDGIVIKARAYSGHTGKNANMTIVVSQGPGKYRFQKNAP